VQGWELATVKFRSRTLDLLDVLPIEVVDVR
jgi:hypothetical protein